MIEKISITKGQGKNKKKDVFEILHFPMGKIVSIVGPTGSGKTTFINDLELFADENTPTKRKVLINDQKPPLEYREQPSLNPIALITQHTNFLSDLPVEEFLKIHAEIRSKDHTKIQKMIDETLVFANQLTGEAIQLESRMTELSGGQTRSLLIADATVICNTPIVLLDEVENAGINRTKALELLRKYQKIFIFVTHDPRIILLSDFRIIMEEGRVKKVLSTNEEEKKCAHFVNKMDDKLASFREKLRSGFSLTLQAMEG